MKNEEIVNRLNDLHKLLSQAPIAMEKYQPMSDILLEVKGALKERMISASAKTFSSCGFCKDHDSCKMNNLCKLTEKPVFET